MLLQLGKSILSSLGVFSRNEKIINLSKEEGVIIIVVTTSVDTGLVSSIMKGKLFLKDIINVIGPEVRTFQMTLK